MKQKFPTFIAAVAVKRAILGAALVDVVGYALLGAATGARRALLPAAMMHPFSSAPPLDEPRFLFRFLCRSRPDAI